MTRRLLPAALALLLAPALQAQDLENAYTEFLLGQMLQRYFQPDLLPLRYGYTLAAVDSVVVDYTGTGDEDFEYLYETVRGDSLVIDYVGDYEGEGDDEALRLAIALPLVGGKARESRFRFRFDGGGEVSTGGFSLAFDDEGRIATTTQAFTDGVDADTSTIEFVYRGELAFAALAYAGPPTSRPASPDTFARYFYDERDRLVSQERRNDRDEAIAFTDVDYAGDELIITDTRTFSPGQSFTDTTVVTLEGGEAIDFDWRFSDDPAFAYNFFRADDGDDPRRRTYLDVGSYGTIRYDYFYRAAVSDAPAAPLVPARLTFASPARPGQTVLAEAIPAGARLSLVDLRGRVLLSQKLTNDAPVAMPLDLAAGAYHLVVSAPGHQPRAWTIVFP